MSATLPVVAKPRATRSDGTTEEPVWFSRAEEMLFGVWNRPGAQELPSDAALVCVHNGGYNMSAHHNQMWSRLCRDVARAGMNAFRFDLTGTGDSTGVDVRDPYGQAADDVLAAVSWLRAQGMCRVALIGTCRGALVSLGAASRVPGLAGVFLCAPALAVLSPGHDGLQPWQAPTLSQAVSDAASVATLRRLVADRAYRQFVVERAEKRLARSLRRTTGDPSADAGNGPWGQQDPMAPLRWLVENEIPVEVFLGRQDPHYRQLQDVRSGVLGRLIDEAPNVQLAVVDGSVHRFISIEGQERFLDAARSWTNVVLG